MSILETVCQPCFVKEKICTREKYKLIGNVGTNNLYVGCISESLVVQKEPSGDFAINREVNCVCMSSVDEISTE
jgi:hypothetical protein